MGVALALVAVVAAGCGSSGATGGGGSGPLRLAATVAPITSIVAAIGGDRVEITGIVPEGTNSHTFEPKPSVAELLSTADVVFVNGLRLEEPTVELARSSLKDGAEVVELGTESIPEDKYIYDFSFPKKDGRPNPHLWTDPKYAESYARVVRDTLVRRDRANAGYYAANYDSFSAMVGSLDRAMREAFATIPEGSRKLLTYHDAYAYFAQDYGWDVVGAIQVSDFEDPTPREVARLIDQVKSERVLAIFGSEVFPSPVLEQIGREAGATYVDVLRDDDLPGDPGAPEHSWAGLMRFDYATITRAVGGDASALEAVDIAPAVPDKAEYPQ
ncbi:MAG: metal ABC transporter substrate-binding protein [Acidimicrobiales bacterium]